MPGDAMPGDAGAEAELWLPLRQAGPRLGLRPDTVRKKLRRGELTGRKTNDGSWLVRIVPGDAGFMPAPARHEPGTDTTPDAGAGARLAAAEAANAELRARVESLERRLDEGHTGRMRLLELLSAERARVDQLLAAPAQRPRWWLWLRRGG